MCLICLHHCSYSSCWPPSLYIKYLIFSLLWAFKVFARVLQRVYKATCVRSSCLNLIITCGGKKKINRVNSYFNTKKKSKWLCGLYLSGEAGGVCGAGAVRGQTIQICTLFHEGFPLRVSHKHFGYLQAWNMQNGLISLIKESTSKLPLCLFQSSFYWVRCGRACCFNMPKLSAARITRSIKRAWSGCWFFRTRTVNTSKAHHEAMGAQSLCPHRSAKQA